MWDLKQTAQSSTYIVKKCSFEVIIFEIRVVLIKRTSFVIYSFTLVQRTSEPSVKP